MPEQVSVPKRLTTGRIDSCKIVEVIEIVLLRGKGVEEDLLRTVTQWRTKSGEFIAEHDPCPATAARTVGALVAEAERRVEHHKRELEDKAEGIRGILRTFGLSAMAQVEGVRLLAEQCEKYRSELELLKAMPK